MWARLGNHFTFYDGMSCWVSIRFSQHLCTKILSFNSLNEFNFNYDNVSAEGERTSCAW